MGEGESRSRHLCLVVIPVAVNAPFMLLCKVGEFPGQGKVLELSSGISSAVRFNTPKSIKLKGSWSPELSGVSGEGCVPLQGPPFPRPLLLGKMISQWSGNLVRPALDLLFNATVKAWRNLNNIGLLALVMFLKLWFQQCKGDCLSLCLVFPGYYRWIAGLHFEINFISFVKSIA